MNRKIYRYISFCLLACFIVLTVGCSSRLLNRDKSVVKDAPIGFVDVSVDVSRDPQQFQSQPLYPFALETAKGVLTITPMAEYRISAMIVGTKEYSSGWTAQISPIDLALAWGGLAKPDYEKYIEYDQSGRWYYFHYNKNSPFDYSYISRHSSNNHIIPATENLKKLLPLLKVKQPVRLEGYLVNVDGTYDGQKVWWHSSLSRQDTGNGACEVFYLRKAVVNGYVYE